MKKLTFMLLLIVSFDSWALDLKVYGEKNYQLTLTDREIHFEYPLQRVTLLKKPCNLQLFQRLQTELKNKKSYTAKAADTIQVIEDGKAKFVKKSSGYGKFLVELPKLMNSFKFEDRMKCGGDPR